MRAWLSCIADSEQILLQVRMTYQGLDEARGEGGGSVRELLMKTTYLLKGAKRDQLN